MAEDLDFARDDIGERLPDGDSTGSGVERVGSCINSIVELPPAEYGLPKAKTKLSSLSDLAELLDPSKNSGSFRLCQDACVERGIVGPLLGLALHGVNDALRVKSLEVLTRLAFGNDRAAGSIANNEDLMPNISAMLERSEQPERLSVLQLMQAIAASPVPEVVNVIPAFVEAAVAQISGTTYAVIPQAAFDVLVSCSFADALATADAAGWSLLASIIAEDESRPPWLPLEPLYVLTGGLLVTNALSSSVPEGVDISARTLAAERLSAGRFIEFLQVAIAAAAQRREWPLGSGAYHSVARLADVACRLDGKYRRQLAGAIEPLASAVESSPDGRATKSSLRALRVLAEDVTCFSALASLVEFRNETLELLHKSGDEVEATELASYLVTVDGMFGAAQAALDESKSFVTCAPTVKQLAEVFATFASLDNELTEDNLLQALPLVPVGPVAAIKSSLSSGGRKAFSFQAFAEHVYGTPTMLGWWPSLMEDSAALLRFSGETPRLPLLPRLLELFELGAHGTASIRAAALLDEVLPAANLPTSGDIVEQAFVELRDDIAIDLKGFVAWMAKLCEALAAAQTEEEPKVEALG